MRASGPSGPTSGLCHHPRVPGRVDDECVRHEAVCNFRLPTVPPPSIFNYSSIFLPYNLTLAEAKSRPFHVYDPEFYAVIGANPKLSRVFGNPDYAAAHGAAVYDEPTNTLFFAANAGGPKGFSGLNSTNRVFRMNVTEAERAASTATLNDDGDYVGANVTLHQIPTANLENVNGGAKYNGQIAFMTEGRSDNLVSQITLVNPMEPYNFTVLLNNFFGRQFNSLNDAAYHRATGDLFFTDVDYGYLSGWAECAIISSHGPSSCFGSQHWMGDGIAVYNPLGRLIGKIFVGSTSANFAWGGDGKLFILAETKVYLAEIAAKGDPVWRN
ncbi:hypothetical protein QFC21_005287 [Naganishia friedmannii]|uniref:Uncharacterized protein n=1 Tax=Naganishia friedmannii TaxID=89922 RepID=A0ACC2VC14_9TREE|nr:hypothetical protein QFC21_005287 [Naganishia friedmannii]